MGDGGIRFAEIPNAETLAAMEETDEMIRTGGGQRFTRTAADFFAALDAEERRFHFNE